MNKGEMLIESIITLYYLSVILFPLSSSIQFIIKNNNKLNERYYNKINSLNMIEDIKNFNYDKIEKFNNKTINGNINEQISIFNLDNNDYYLKVSENYNILITKTDYFYNDKKYIFYIKVNQYEDYYIPK
ncbi:hypothetical protein [Caviibacter abscessus]|uniref:hypothetical protein n=1 Tax=Caviibacter abscessus TaxID=1766719 RepID=UPI000836C462|nr:hypothetical protein [Caviibacter abscessus]